MRQRNETGYAQHVSAWPTDDHPDRTPFAVSPGEIVDFPELLAGFTPVENEPAPEPRAKSRKTTTAAADTPEGGEPR